jgi:hypothetical protein
LIIQPSVAPVAGEAVSTGKRRILRSDLNAKTPHGDGQTILREALLIADHNAYHLGALVVMARIVKTNPGR